jgi:hypothetical protein
MAHAEHYVQMEEKERNDCNALINRGRGGTATDRREKKVCPSRNAGNWPHEIEKELM